MSMMRSTRDIVILIGAAMMGGVQMASTPAKRKLHIHLAMILEFMRNIVTMMTMVNLDARAEILQMRAEF